jgi:hypothetical protein
VKGLPQAAANHRQRHGGIEIPCTYIIILPRLKTSKPALYGIIDDLVSWENPEDEQFYVGRFTLN